jgi:hypothetical protein
VENYENRLVVFDFIKKNYYGTKPNRLMEFHFIELICCFSTARFDWAEFFLVGLEFEYHFLKNIG